MDMERTEERQLQSSPRDSEAGDKLIEGRQKEVCQGESSNEMGDSNAICWWS